MVQAVRVRELRIDHGPEREQERAPALWIPLDRAQHVAERLDRGDARLVRLLADAVLARRLRREGVARQRGELGVVAHDLAGL